MSKRIIPSKEVIQKWKTSMSSTLEKLSIHRPTTSTTVRLWQPGKQQQLLERLQLETQKRNLQWKEWLRVQGNKWQTSHSSSSSSRWSTTRMFIDRYQQWGETIWRGFFRWSLALVFVYGVATTLPIELVREFRKTQTITASNPTTTTPQSSIDSKTNKTAGATEGGPMEFLGSFFSKISSWIGSDVFKDDNQK